MTENRELRDGRDDGLVPLEAIDLKTVSSFAELLRAMSGSAFSGRQLGEAFSVLREMFHRSSCQVVLTLSGAMTVAKQGLIICEMLDRGWISAIVSTGALIAHGLTESIGLTHYRYDPAVSDESLFQKGYNRIYDTLEMEANLNDVDRLVSRVLTEEEPPGGTWCSSSLCRAIGQQLSEADVGAGILRSAFERDVPVFIPAFTDSEVGLNVVVHAMRMSLAELPAVPTAAAETLQPVPAFNPYLDLQAYARLACDASELGIFTIGGGVPRNWAQQVAPYIDIANYRLGMQLPVPRFKYGVRICPEPVHWGGLSGCTYSEGISWGKFVTPSDGGRFAEVYSDATVVLPLLVKALMEETGSGAG